MGATTFETIAFGRTAGEAFDAAVKDALYWHGHGGYTGTIAEKDGFVNAGQLHARWEPRIYEFFSKVQDWVYKGRKSKAPKGIPPSLVDLFVRFYEAWDEKWGPAVCFELTGPKRLAEIKRTHGMANRHVKVFVFCGWASI